MVIREKKRVIREGSITIDERTTMLLHTVLSIPMYLVQNISDHGIYESEMPDGSIDSDDLRITIELSSSHLIFLHPEMHIYIDKEVLKIVYYRLEK